MLNPLNELPCWTRMCNFKFFNEQLHTCYKASLCQQLITNMLIELSVFLHTECLFENLINIIKNI